LAKREKTWLMIEYESRKNFAKGFDIYARTLDEKQKEYAVLNAPLILKREERYICPSEHFWEKRYYKCLFPNNNVALICSNYLEGLEWVFTYYTRGCPDWRWKYNYHYPPLLCDLAKHVSHRQKKFFPETKTNPFSKTTQLEYVMPSKNAPPPEYVWAFKRYFWESHIQLPDISLPDISLPDISLPDISFPDVSS
jgi:5'-3' exonuclease